MWIGHRKEIRKEITVANSYYQPWPVDKTKLSLLGHATADILNAESTYWWTADTMPKRASRILKPYKVRDLISQDIWTVDKAYFWVWLW